MGARHRARVLRCAALAVLAVVGCGKSPSSTPNAGGAASALAGSGQGGFNAGSSGSGAASSAGAASTSGGSASGNGEGGSAIVLGDSLTEACIGYVLAVCGRQSACSLGSQGCLNSAFECPDLTASPGATRTIADLQACAKAYQDLPCDQVRLGVYPACVKPGTRAIGDACLYSSQCSSLSCSGEAQCRSCVPLSHQGESCANDEACAGYLRCQLGKCELPEDSTSAPVPTVVGLGMTCSSDSSIYCEQELYCDPASSKCAAFPSLGESCVGPQLCAGGAYCEADGLTCKALPGEGAPCGVHALVAIATACAGELWCARSSATVGVCRKPPLVGEPCLIDPETGRPQYQSCDFAVARCDAAKSPPTCVAKAAKGESCKDTIDCAADSCVCADGRLGCDARICGRIQYGDQPCAAPGDVCHAGFTCTAGVCKPRDSQGLFAAACGP